MYRRKFPGILTAVLALMVLLVAPGCWNPWDPDVDDGDDDQPIEQYDRTSCGSLMNFFASAHERRSIDEYAESLHDEYIFVFSEEDRNDPLWEWKEWIAKSEDLDVTGSMFAAGSVTDIRVDFNNVTVDPDTAGLWIGEEPVDDPPGGVRRFYWGLFGVDMHVVEDSGDESIDHWVDGKAHVFFLPDPNFEGLWVIWKIEDKGNPHEKGVEESVSWSALKNEMRKDQGGN